MEATLFAFNKNNAELEEFIWLLCKKTHCLHPTTKQHIYNMVSSSLTLEPYAPWLDDSCFLLQITDGQMCVWQQPRTAYAKMKYCRNNSLRWWIGYGVGLFPTTENWIFPQLG